MHKRHTHKAQSTKHKAQNTPLPIIPSSPLSHTHTHSPPCASRPLPTIAVDHRRPLSTDTGKTVRTSYEILTDKLRRVVKGGALKGTPEQAMVEEVVSALLRSKGNLNADQGRGHHGDTNMSEMESKKTKRLYEYDDIE